MFYSMNKREERNFELTWTITSSLTARQPVKAKLQLKRPMYNFKNSFSLIISTFIVPGAHFSVAIENDLAKVDKDEISRKLFSAPMSDYSG